MRYLILALTYTLLFFSSAIAAQPSVNEWEINRLISPSFSELQSEAILGKITCYSNIPNNIIKDALNKHFERIEFMSFDNCKQEAK